MARLSDVIEEFIKELLGESKGRAVEIQRNELASFFDCAPSQINYVLSTRFSVEKGYSVESRRGGGGHIRIIRLEIENKENVYNIINQIGDSISFTKGISIVNFLQERGIINEREGNIILAAINNRSLSVDGEIKNKLRASILKAMLASLLR